MTNTKQIYPPVTYFGSKSRYVKSIVRHFPEHQTFVDVFGGSGAILLGKRPSKVEVYNDLNQKMANLFKVLASDEKTEQLIRALEVTPYSREAFASSREELKSEQNDVELARHMIVVQRQSHGGLGKQWSYCVDAPAGGYSASVRKFHAGIERLPEVHKRMRKVQIEGLCFSDLMPRYDRAGTLFYLDPPYAPETRTSGKYVHEMTIDEHKKLVSILLTIKGMAILSGYATDLYLPLEAAGFQRIEIDTTTNAGKSRGSRTECLWISPNCLSKKENISDKMQVDDESLNNRQKAALRVHRHRVEKSEKMINEAIYSLKRMKKKVSKVAVARMTGISREQLSRRYKHLF